MTPQELKNSIIQLAMHGRLVSQISTEESAELLYTRIQKAKQTQGIKPNNKVMPIRDEDIPFDIPESWCWVRFGDIVSYRMGKTPPRAEAQWWKNEVPWVAISDMPENGHVANTKEKVSYTAIQEKFGNTLSKVGTMIMSFKLTVGRVSILDIDAVHNEAIISIYPICDSDNTIQKYLFAILPTVTQYGDSKNAIKGKTLNDTSISNLLIPLPPLAEQKRIVVKIEELLPLIDRYEKAWNRLEAFNEQFPGDMQKSILQMAIQGKLVEQRPEEGTGEELYQRIQQEKQKLTREGKIKKEKPLPEITEAETEIDIPDSWKLCKLGQLSKKITDGEHKTPRRVEQYCGYYLLSARNIKDGHIDLSDVDYVDNDEYEIISKRCNPTNGDILISCSGSVGRCAVIQDHNSYVMVRSAAMISLIYIDSQYAMFALQSEYVQKQIKNRTKQTAQANLFQDAINNLVIPLPPLSEQKRIVAHIEELLPLCDHLNRLTEKTRQ